ncbi:Copper-sensing two-component system response regulator CpxR [Salmonella enterica subsp. enterica serovar Uganda str. R8-3404]|uniref:Copper-sensing two-component system response regulator CpxR n=1 Tax=Salmonella enterica subsp. enterica serovar Uganda str. R8-3404 TaxID=913083 RepID=A0A6C8GUF1_SALET|nr:Copper-sensing two-component system response regulator CpxR [Salmonella enterica subsp. enterica serovar Uganda str. R8-3404]
MNKILLVDDDRELTSLLKELLEMEGFNVLVAHDGEQALELLDDSIDLLLLDVMMPKKNGIDTLKALRQTHQTPVIMLTARGNACHYADRARRARQRAGSRSRP